MMKPKEATLRSKIEVSISGLVTAKGYLDDLSENSDAGIRKQMRRICKEQIDAVTEHLNELTDAIEKNRDLS